jgi:hypothetical protein
MALKFNNAVAVETGKWSGALDFLRQPGLYATGAELNMAGNSRPRWSHSAQ